MTTIPRVPGIDFSITAPAPAPVHHLDDTVYLVGLAGTGGSAAVGDLVGPFGSEADAAAALGTGSALRAAVHAIYQQASPTIYCAISAATAPGKPSAAEVVAALGMARALPVTPTVLGAPGLCSGTDADASSLTSLTASGVVAGGRALAGEFDSVFVADGPDGSAITATDIGTWADANVGAGAMMVANAVRVGGAYVSAAGYWIGAALAVTAEYGRARGLADAPVASAAAVRLALTSSPRPSVTTQVSTLVGKYVSVLHRGPGGVMLIGETIGGVTDLRRLWSVSRVVAHAERVMRGAARAYMGASTRPVTLGVISQVMQTAGRTLVTADPPELDDLVVRPDVARNTPAARAAQQGFFIADLGLIVPLNRISVGLALSL